MAKAMRPIGLLLLLYIGFCAYLFLFQNSLLFFPTKMSEERWKYVADDVHADYVTIRVNEEGNHLQGWFIAGKAEKAGGAETSPQEQKLPTVIFFGGNAMEIDTTIYDLLPLRENAVNLLLVDYRGYGLSEGKPGADTMKKDAEKVFDAAASHPLVDEEHIIAWGYSLGTGVAAHLASVRPSLPRTDPEHDEGSGAGVEKVILFAPFTSTLDLAKEHYPFFPVDLLLRHRFETLTLAPTLNQPVLIIHGDEDEEFGIEHAEKIAAAWKGPKELLVLDGRGHSDLLEDQKAWDAVWKFLQK